MNCKLGGELWSCSPTPFRDLMVVGIDVFHDRARRDGSVAGVVATVNGTLTRFHSNAVFQQQVGQPGLKKEKGSLCDHLFFFFFFYLQGQ